MTTHFKAEKPRPICTYCYGYSLQLAVGDMIKEEKNLKGALDSTSKTSKLLKYLPKKETLFKTVKEEFTHGTSSFQTLWPTRWTVRAVSLQNVIENRKVSQELRNECLETKLDPEIGGRVFFVCLFNLFNVGVIIYKVYNI